MVLRSILRSAKPPCMGDTISTFEERMFFVSGEEVDSLEPFGLESHNGKY